MLTKIDDAIHKDFIIEQLQYFMRCRRTLISKSCGDNNPIATAFDAGYLACLSELEDIIMHPPKEQDEKDINGPYDIDEDEDESDE